MTQGTHGLTASDFCWYCGTRLQGEIEGRHDFGTRDHVVPRSQNGRGPGNYVDACLFCNSLKKDLSLEAFRRRLGTGLFWGELFSTQKVPGSMIRAATGREFGVWLGLQATDRKDDWKFRARAAVSLLSLTRSGVEPLAPAHAVPPVPDRHLLPNRGSAPSSRTPMWHLRKALAVAIYGLAWKIDPEGAR